MHLRELLLTEGVVLIDVTLKDAHFEVKWHFKSQTWIYLWVPVRYFYYSVRMRSETCSQW